MPVLETIERTTIRFIATEARDPLEIDDPCRMNGGGPHYDIAGCREIACVHCGRIVWS